MCHFTDANAEIKSQLITGCLLEKVRQKGLMNSNMLLGDLINYAKNDGNYNQTPGTDTLRRRQLYHETYVSINTLVNKVAHEQQQPRKHPRHQRDLNSSSDMEFVFHTSKVKKPSLLQLIFW